MIGVIVNAAAVFVGSSFGLLLKKHIPEKLGDSVIKAIGICIIYIGISGAMSDANILAVIVSMALGTAIGTALDLDRRLNNLAKRIETKFKKGNEEVGIAQGFVNASLLFCVGAMTIVGSLDAGIKGDNTMLFTKSTLDFISSIVFASTMGIGVMMSGMFVLVFQGSLVLLGSVIEPFLGDDVVAGLTCVGSLLILAMGLNLIGVTKFKVIDCLPCLILIVFMVPIFKMIGV